MEKYKVLGQFDSGAYSKVYKAIHYQSNQLYAIKVMKSSNQSRQNLLMHRQIRNLKNCTNHPNIIHLVQVIRNEQNVFLVFEYMPMNLINYYKMIQQNQKRNLSQREIVYIFRQICLAVQYMHSKGIMHRDIKPQNVLINPQTLETKLIDFGFSKIHRNHQIHTDYVSTRWYRPIEIVLSLPYDFKADVFSLGALLLQLYIGCQVFRSKSNIDQLFWITKICGPPKWKQAIERINQFRVTVDLDENPMLQGFLTKLRPQTANIISLMLQVAPFHRPDIHEILTNQYFDMYVNEKKNAFSKQQHKKSLYLYRSPSQITLSTNRKNKKSFLKEEKEEQIVYQSQKMSRKMINSRSNPYLQHRKNISNQIQSLKFQQRHNIYEPEHANRTLDWKINKRAENYIQKRNEAQKLHELNVTTQRNTTAGSFTRSSRQKQNYLRNTHNQKAVRDTMKDVQQYKKVLAANKSNQSLIYDYEKDKYKSLTNMFTKIKKIINVERGKQKQPVIYQSRNHYQNQKYRHQQLPSSISKSKQRNLQKNQSCGALAVGKYRKYERQRDVIQPKYAKNYQQQASQNAFRYNYGLKQVASMQRLRENTFR